MKRGRRAWFTAAVCGIVILGAVVWIVRTKDTDAFFAAALQQEHVRERVVVNGVAYTVLDGQVEREDKGVIIGNGASGALRTAYALAITRRSPLLSLEGTNPNELERAIAALQSLQQTLASTQENERDTQAVGSALYPLAFLKAVARAARARQTFLASGDRKDLEVYLLAQTETVNVYGSDAAKFEQGFADTVPNDAGSLGVAGGKVLSVRSELQSIEGIKHNAAVMQKAVEIRNACLSGKVSTCNADDAILPLVAQGETNGAASASLPRTQEVMDILIKPAVSPTSQTVSERDSTSLPRKRLNLSESACTGSTSDNLVFVFREQENKDGTLSAFLMFVGDILISNTGPFVGSEYVDYVASKGVKYIPYWPTSPHTCPELGSDSGTGLALLMIAKAAEARPFSTSVAANAAPLAVMEKTFSGEKFLRESEVRRYLALVRESLLLDRSASVETENRYISLALQLQNRSAGLPDLIYRLVDETSVETKASSLFFVRSFFFSLFMGHNPSFSPEPVPPHEPELLPPDRQSYTPYSAIRSSVPLEELRRDINRAI